MDNFDIVVHDSMVLLISSKLFLMITNVKEETFERFLWMSRNSPCTILLTYEVMFFEAKLPFFLCLTKFVLKVVSALFWHSQHVSAAKAHKCIFQCRKGEQMHLSMQKRRTNASFNAANAHKCIFQRGKGAKMHLLLSTSFVC
jgi:hypothetical protein